MKVNFECIDEAKRKGTGKLRYLLRNANVLESSKGYFFIDYMDPMDEVDPIISGRSLTPELVNYIENSLQSNSHRFKSEVEVIKSLRATKGGKILDVGCGGGHFLAIMKDLGAKVTGIELDDARAYYAQTVNGLNVVKRPLEDDYWRSEFSHYDIVTLWDVIEHVNFPVETIKAAYNMLKPEGYLIIDTPCKDSFYHRFGQFTYFISGGRLPTFLNIMYSSHRFGHKQIFSTSELIEILRACGFDVVRAEKFHELSFPVSFYLLRLTRSKLLTKLLAPIVEVLFKVVRIRNKMLLVARMNSPAKQVLICE